MEATEAEDDDDDRGRDGARELAAAFRTRVGASDLGGRRWRIARLRAAGLRATVLVTADDVSPGKPDPAGYLAGRARLRARPEAAC